MRSAIPEELINARLKIGPYNRYENYDNVSNDTSGLMGVFYLRLNSNPDSVLLKVISSGPASEHLQGWEHVSVSSGFRYPTWEEMCYVKNLFWRDEEAVIQFHPPKSKTKNCHPFCLHLWKPTGFEIELPSMDLI